MARWIEFDQLKAQVSIKEVLGRYGILQAGKERKTRRGVELKLHCLFHEDHTPSLSVHLDTGRFHCFGCHAKGGDIFDFVALKEGIATEDRNHNRRQAALLIAEWFGIVSGRPTEEGKALANKVAEASVVEVVQEEGKPAKEEHKVDAPTNTHPFEQASAEIVNPPLKFAFENVDQAHPYLRARGLTQETIERFGVGYHAGRGIMSGRCVIPIHNEQGALVAYTGRWPGDEGWPEGEDKYKLPPGFHKSLVVFNLHRAREHAAEGLIVVEGFFDCMDLWQRGRKNVVALMGCTMSEAQERLIVGTVGPRGRVLLMFDPDEAGRKGSADAISRLVSQVFVREVVLPVRGS